VRDASEIVMTVVSLTSLVGRLCVGSAEVVQQCLVVSASLDDFRFAGTEFVEDATFAVSSGDARLRSGCKTGAKLPPISGCTVGLTNIAEDSAVDELHPVSAQSFARDGPEPETYPNSVELSTAWQGLERTKDRLVE